jgi:CheY-like chemotaxis protein
MTVDDFIKVTTAVAGFLNTIAWPLVVLLIVHKFAPLLRDFLANMTEGTVKAFGIEANAKRNATIEIVKADLKRSVSISGQDNLVLLTAAEHSLRQADAITHILPMHELKGKRVLWLDDQPEDTYYERRALIELGMELEIETDIDEAIDTLSKTDWDAVVIVPPHFIPSNRGDELLELMNKRGSTFIIYQQQKPPSQEQYEGAYAIVNQTADLVLQVASATAGFRGSDAMQFYVGFKDYLKRMTRMRERM